MGKFLNASKLVLLTALCLLAWVVSYAAPDTIAPVDSTKMINGVAINTFTDLLSQYFEVGLSFTMLVVGAALKKYLPKLVVYNRAITSGIAFLVLGAIWVYICKGNWSEVYSSAITAVFTYNNWAKAALAESPTVVASTVEPTPSV